MRFLRRVRRRTLGLLALPVAVALLTAPATQAAAAPTDSTTAGAVQAIAGQSTAPAAHSVDARQAAAAPRITPDPLTPADQALLDRAAAARQSPGVAAGTGANRAAASPPATPLAAASVPINLNVDGLNQAQACGGCMPSDPGAAVGANEIVETVNTSYVVGTKTGSPLCGSSFNNLLNTKDGLSDPRVMYDNVNGRYLGVITDTTVKPSLWVFATQTNNPCGSWWYWHTTFSGSSFPSGTLVDYPILGQDRNAMLLSTDNFTPTSGENFTVLGYPKSALYSGGTFNVSAFNTASFTAPASNGGIPMINTTYSYFLGAVPGTGYRLYRLTNSGGSGATLTLQATINSPFTAPSPACQPGTTKLDTLDGRIQWSPVNDGTNIWFAHTIQTISPTVRYGKINIATNALSNATAFHKSTSNDFNPSIGVGNNPGGGNNIFLNWAYTDCSNNVPTTAAVNSTFVAAGGTLSDLIGTETALATGVTTSETRFGDYSSVAIDPTNANGTCAVTAQQYFPSGGGGQWGTRVARVGTC